MKLRIASVALWRGNIWLHTVSLEGARLSSFLPPSTCSTQPPLVSRASSMYPSSASAMRRQ